MVDVSTPPRPGGPTHPNRNQKVAKWSAKRSGSTPHPPTRPSLRPVKATPAPHPRLRTTEPPLRERGEVPRAQATRAHPDNRFAPLQNVLGLVEVGRAELFGAAGGGLVGVVPVGVLLVHLRLGLRVGDRRVPFAT